MTLPATLADEDKEDLKIVHCLQLNEKETQRLHELRKEINEIIENGTRRCFSLE